MNEKSARFLDCFVGSSMPSRLENCDPSTATPGLALLSRAQRFHAIIAVVVGG